MSPASRRFGVIVVISGLGLGVFSILADGIIRWQPITILGNLASPWGLVAFALGRLAGTRTRGATAGAAALLIGEATYYTRSLLAGFGFISYANLLWIVVAIVLGPLLGAAGAASKEEPQRAWAAAAPSLLLIAESLFFLYDRRIWLWDLAGRPELFQDLGVVAMMLVTAAVLPVRLAIPRARLRTVYGMAIVGGLAGAVGFIFFYELLVSVFASD
jgi:hypothetical protein